VLICPYRHVADFTDLTVEESSELSWFQARMMRAIRAASNPQGFNIGLNQGSAAGAGISGHLHQHIVPRWRGDSNFMTTVGGSRTMVVLLEESRDLFAAALSELD
jgi:ATP adenylyltransferase